MKITKIRVENFKSIRDIEFDLKKYGNSYTTMLVGINESGKSNILEAMSFMNVSDETFEYSDVHNQKDEVYDPVDLWFHFEFENKKTYLDYVQQGVENGEFLDFEVKNIVRNVYLESDANTFSIQHTFELSKLSKNLFVKTIDKSILNAKGSTESKKIICLSKSNDDEESFTELTEEVFRKLFTSKITAAIYKYQPNVSLWSPSERYLISKVDLEEFKENINSNIPLKHIFYIAGYHDESSIVQEITNISRDNLRRKLQTKLSDECTKYVNEIWKQHNIKVDIEIAPDSSCSVHIKDGGANNEHYYYKMTDRSQGFKQFMSLILSLSIETKFSHRHNELILIDEPETHLHPSAIRYLRDELLKIGKNNYLFISTHSPFLIDKRHKERNIIIRKNTNATTEKILIDAHTDVIDDEVLREAFGIEVYKDLLNPHSILVEGKSDKVVFQKILQMNNLTNFGVTNGHGSNIDTLASKLNDQDMKVLVVLDDDKDGKRYKGNIIKLGGSYSSTNVVTIRDLVGNIVESATIEDTFGISFLQSQLTKFLQESYPNDNLSFTLTEASPFLIQTRTYLNQIGKESTEVENFIEKLKIRISNEFSPSLGSFSKKFPLLKELVEKISERLS